MKELHVMPNQLFVVINPHKFINQLCSRKEHFIIFGLIVWGLLHADMFTCPATEHSGLNKVKVSHLLSKKRQIKPPSDISTHQREYAYIYNLFTC